MRLLGSVVAGFLLAACAGGTPGSPHSLAKVSPVPGGLTAGLIAFRSLQGIGVLDPNTGKQTLVIPLSR